MTHELTSYQQRVKATLVRHPNMSVALIAKLINVPNNSRRVRVGMDYNDFVKSFAPEPESKIQAAVDVLMAKRILIQTCSFPSRYAVKTAKVTVEKEDDEEDEYVVQELPDPTEIGKFVNARGLDALLAPSASMTQADMRHVSGRHVVVA